MEYLLLSGIAKNNEEALKLTEHHEKIYHYNLN